MLDLQSKDGWEPSISSIKAIQKIIRKSLVNMTEYGRVYLQLHTDPGERFNRVQSYQVHFQFSARL